MLVWLVRFLFRHPVLVSAAVIGVLMWRVIGWLGLVVLAVSIAVVLVVWWWRFRVSFSRFVAGPARARWRAWHYRRRWAAVMTIGRLAPLYQGRVMLPVLGKVSATRFTDRVPVRLVSGQSAADFAARADNLATGSAPCSAGSALPRRVRWCWSSSAATPWPSSSLPWRSRSVWSCGRCRWAAARTV